MRSLRNGLLAVLGTLALGFASGCASDATDSSDITKIGESRVKEQSVGNCWVYATLGWVESLQVGTTRQELNLSESYITYMHWFERIDPDI